MNGMVSALLIVLLLINVATLFLVIYSQSKKILMSIAGGFMIVITQYMLIGLFATCFDWYSSIGFMLISILLSFLIAVHYRVALKDLLKNFKKSFKFNLIPIPYIFVLGLVVLSMIFMNGYFGMGQDQGVYQVKAIALSSGESDNAIALENERGILKTLDFTQDNDEFDNYVRVFFNSQVGFYGNADENGYDDTLTAVIHGTTSYPSLLAFDIEAFGLSGILNVNFVLVFISFVFLMEILEHLNVNKFLGTIVLFIGILSPAVIWVAKSSLTESVQLPLLIAIIYGLIVMTDNKRYGLLIATVATIGQSVLHLSAFSILPAIGVLFLVVFLRTGDKLVLICNLIITVIYELAFLVQCKLFDIYVTANITLSLNKMLGREFPHSFYVSLISITGMVLALITLIFLIPKVREIALKLMNKAVYPVVVLLVLAVSIAMFVRSFVSQIGINGLEASVYNFTVDGILLSCGIILLPLALVFCVIFINKAMKDSKLEILVIAFIYFVFFLQATLHPVTNHYYYYARYFTPVVFLVPLLFATLSDRFVKKEIYSCTAGLLAVIVILPFSLFVSSMKDDTNMSWRELSEYSKNFSNGDAVVFSGGARKELLLATKFLSGADVYVDYVPEMELDSRYENVYHVCINGTRYDDGELVYQKNVEVSSDPQLPHKYIFPLFDFAPTEYDLEVYKFNPERLNNEIFYSLFDVELVNFAGTAGYYSWTQEVNSDVLLEIPEDINGKKIHVELDEFLNSLIPAYLLSDSVNVYVNGELCMTSKFSDLGNEIILDSECFVPGQINDIGFEFALWQPCVEYPDLAGDDGFLGFAIDGISIR